MKYFKRDTIISFVSKCTYLAINILFWFTLDSIGYTIPQWNYSNLVVFVAFSELFYGLDAAIFSTSSRFWQVIFSGILDNWLTRPIDPRVRFILLNINYMELVFTFIEFFGILAVFRAPISVGYLVVGVISIIWANVILCLLRGTMANLAFWHGKMEAITEIADALSVFNKYPLVIVDRQILVLFKLVFPFYFFSTFATEINCSKMQVEEVGIHIGMLLVVTCLWIVINEISWRKGLKRYEGIYG